MNFFYSEHIWIFIFSVINNNNNNNNWYFKVEQENRTIATVEEREVQKVSPVSNIGH